MINLNQTIDVSIIIITYNYAQYIEECINSCLFQQGTKLKFEILVIDDGSTDDTSEILKKFNKKEIKQFRINNSGIEIASNFGFNKAKGKFIVRVDADDKLKPKFLHLLEKNLSSNFDFYYSDYEVIDNKGGLVSRMCLPEFDKNEIFERGDFLATGTVYAAKILKKYCYYNEGIKNSGLENYELILRLIKDQKIGKHIATSMFYYRRHNSNISIKKNQQIINNGGVLFEKLGLGTYRTNKFHPYNPQEA